MRRYIIDNASNYKKYKNWICGHFLPKEYMQSNTEFEVKYSEREPGHTESEHYHPQGKEVCIVVEGALRMKIDGKETILKEGDFLYSEGGITEEVLEVIKPTKVISVRVPSLPDNKIYK